tara:strand:- start:470 stop:1699 length:1230 start_codon:yes stop_codon:yes gene_type:complete
MSTEIFTAGSKQASKKQVKGIQAVILKRFSNLKYGSIRIAFTENHAFYIKGKFDGPRAEIKIENPFSFIKSVALGGDLGFAESYMRGDWSSENMPELLYLLSLNLDALDSVQQRSLPVKLISKFQHIRNRNSQLGSRKNIAAHYDLGNDFYERWLDSSMSYSSAIFDISPDLQKAQERKYELMLSLIDPEPGDHILEIGCGWGGFAEYAANWGMKVTGITLSKEQYTYAKNRIKNKRLDNLVNFKLMDYRNIEGQYDHIVSIEMFEAVGQEYWAEYYRVLNKCLKPGGRASLQIITIREDLFDKYLKEAGGFIQQYIFPGGMLPTETHLTELAWKNNFEPLSIDRYGKHYADTLAYWLGAFEKQESWMESNGYDLRFRRMWRYYLSFCEAGFRDDRINLVHLLMRKEHK